MNGKVVTTDGCVSREQMVLYVDGVLTPADEAAVESHVKFCSSCLAVLNSEKALFGAIDGIFDDDKAPEVPAGFARAVASAAESEVQGLRSAKVRIGFLLTLLILTTSLWFLVPAGSLSGAGLPVGAAGAFVRLVSLFLHSLADLAVGAVGIMRTMCAEFVPGSQIFAFGLALVLVSSLAVCLRLRSPRHRA